MVSQLASLAEAVALYRGRRYGAARRIVDRILREQPEHGRAWELRGLLWWAVGERGLAEGSLETAMTLVPLCPAAAVALGDCYAAVPRCELSGSLYELASAHPEASVATLLAAAAGLDGLGAPHRSVRICRLAILRDAEFAQSYYDLGYYLKRTGAPPHIVEAAARQAIALAPDRLNYRVGLAGFLAQRGRIAEAHALVEHLQPAAIETAHCPCCLDRLASVFETVGDHERSAACRARSQALTTRHGTASQREVDPCDGC
ncbi:MAG: tetratricopeptide repeat protein [Planctomycetaceae bacterium]|nr:tetratricopeptide repeat protein [Planctomycetaceae bacterium]